MPVPEERCHTAREDRNLLGGDELLVRRGGPGSGAEVRRCIKRQRTLTSLRPTSYSRARLPAKCAVPIFASRHSHLPHPLTFTASWGESHPDVVNNKLSCVLSITYDEVTEDPSKNFKKKLDIKSSVIVNYNTITTGFRGTRKSNPS